MYSLREGQKSDLPRVLELINELALYEKAPEQVTNTLERMEKEGFGPQPVYGFFVCVKDNSQEIIGIAVYYYRYSTWKGQTMYLEDIIVTESMRGKGIGKMLIEKLIEEAKEKGFKRITWQVLDWNEPAINFYKKFNAKFDPEWVNVTIEC